MNPKRSQRGTPAPREKASESQETSEAEPESAPSSAEDGEQADEPDLDEDAVMAEAELVPTEFDQDTDLDDGALPVLASERARGGDASIAKYDPLQAYMREVQQHPLLSKSEEHELATRYVKTGDVDAAARLVTANLRLVVKIAYEYRRAYRNMMDLIQEGNIGLMQAVKRYDPYRGVKLSSYAAWWIRAYMLRYMLNNWRMVKLGTTQAQRKLFFNLRKEREKLEKQGFQVEAKHLAAALDVT